MTTPRISVVIPTYQRRDHALTAVASIAGQQSPPTFDITVVVDGSTDGTADALRALGLPCLRVLEQPNRGAAAARNAGAAACRGEVLLFLDDDMEAAPDLLARHDAAHRSGADVVLGHMPLHPDSPRTVVSQAVAAWADERGERLRTRPASLELHDLLTGQISVSRAAFDAAGGFDLDFTHGGSFGGEDLDFGHRLRRAGRRIVFDPAAVSHQRYAVTGEQYLRQWEEAGASDAILLRKHPELGPELAAAEPAFPGASLLVRLTLAGGPGRIFLDALAALAARVITSGRTGRSAAAFVFAVRDLVYAHGRAGVGRGEVAVLALHAITDLADDALLAPYCITPRHLARMLDDLRPGHTFLSVDALLDGLSGRRPLPRRGLVLTFDDGYADLATVVAPMLRARGIPAAAFVVTQRLGGTNAWDEALGSTSLRLLDPEGLRALTPQPLTIGAHSRTHAELPTLDDQALEAEVAGAADDLERVGLTPRAGFCFPYGEHDDRAVAAAARAGYPAAFTLRPGLVGADSDRHRLPRIELRAGETSRRVRARIAFARRGHALPAVVAKLLRAR